MGWGHAYRLRLKRKRLLWRAFRKRHELRVLRDRSAEIRPGDILCFSTIRNEITRLPGFLRHHRALGVAHFFFVDNDSCDGSGEFLRDQPDVSLWHSSASYRAARFGVDWLMHLQRRYGHGHWCLTLDADELLLIPHHDRADLHDLTGWLEAQGVASFGAMMLDLYPRGRLGAPMPGEDPLQALRWFDPWGYSWEHQPRYRNISIRGGVRKRLFFADAPDYAPHLHKLPLVRWQRGYAYVSSTHVALPHMLNAAFDARREQPTGVLLHTKFLPEIVEKSTQEKHRAEHFTHPARYGNYYDRLAAGPVLCDAQSQRFEDWQQLVALGLMTAGHWRKPLTV